jgi:hypothetical protein
MYHIDIHLITRYMCKLDMAMYSVNCWVFIPSIYICIASILFDVCKAAVQKVFKSQKLQKE